MVRLQLGKASPQHTAASGVNLEGAVMPEPDLETKPWNSSARGGQERRAHMRWFGQRFENSLKQDECGNKKRRRKTEEVLFKAVV